MTYSEQVKETKKNFQEFVKEAKKLGFVPLMSRTEMQVAYVFYVGSNLSIEEALNLK